MKIISCIIIDDEELTIHHLIKYINKIPILKLIQYFTEPSNAIEYLKNNQVDVIFLDIEMPNSNLDGIDFLKYVGDTQNYVLTTSHPKYALTGFEYSVIDFLHKPYSFERFSNAIKKVQKTLTIQETEKEIYLKSEGKLQKIIINSISYIKSEKNNISVFTDTDRINAIYTLSDFERKLPVNLFIRVHKSFIISLKHIISINNDIITIKRGDNEKQIPLGEHYKKLFLEVMSDKIIKK